MNVSTTQRQFDLALQLFYTRKLALAALRRPEKSAEKVFYLFQYLKQSFVKYIPIFIYLEILSIHNIWEFVV